MHGTPTICRQGPFALSLGRFRTLCTKNSTPNTSLALVVLLQCFLSNGTTNQHMLLPLSYLWNAAEWPSAIAIRSAGILWLKLLFETFLALPNEGPNLYEQISERS